MLAWAVRGDQLSREKVIAVSCAFHYVAFFGIIFIGMIVGS
jgi:hypothetical protein